MADCHGTHSVGASVDREMVDHLSEEAERRAVTRAEMIRRLFDLLRDSQEGEVRCPECNSPVVLDP